jgi:sulfoxide reductase heme-binding subunit YedZ
MTIKIRQLTALQIAIHIFGWLPLIFTTYQVLTSNLTANPIQAVEQRFGRLAVYFLLASLACTPVVTLTGWREPIKRRRALGLYAFMYASLHFIVFAGVDYAFDLQQIVRLISEKTFILLGITAGLILLALAVTSFPVWMRLMGKGWQNLHRTVYLGGIIVVIHYAMARKANIATLSGDILQPLLIGMLLMTLLLLRVPVIRKAASKIKYKIKPKN